MLPEIRKLNLKLNGKCRTVVKIISLFRACQPIDFVLLASGILGINKKQNSNFDVNTLLVESGKRGFYLVSWFLNS